MCEIVPVLRMLWRNYGLLMHLFKESAEELCGRALTSGNELLFPFTYEEVCSRAAAAAFEAIDNCSLEMIAGVRVRSHLKTLEFIS